ncbi:MAG: hypothetical protein ABL907_15275 [Hyphomicrobium sp.]
MPTPPCWVFPWPHPASYRPVQDNFDAAPDATGGLGLGRPERLDHLQNMPRLNLGDGKFAQRWMGILLQAVWPLLCMFGVLPGVLVRCDIAVRGLPKSELVRGVNFGRRSTGMPIIDRVNSV